jgi:hypothetical protein
VPREDDDGATPHAPIHPDHGPHTGTVIRVDFVLACPRALVTRWVFFGQAAA